MAGTALVTGAAGFTGSRLVGTLLDRDWEVVATDLDEDLRSNYYRQAGNAPHPEHDPETVAALDVEFVPADLTEPETLRPLFEGHSYDAVFHVASLYDYFAEWEALYEVNVRGAEHIGELAAENGVDHFVHISTLGVFGDAGFEAPKDETAAFEPHNDYSESKVQQEQVLREIAADGDLPLTVLRSAPIYGPGNAYGVYHIPLLLSKLGFAPVWRIYPRGKQPKFPSVHVDDLCRSMLFVHRNRRATAGEDYNVVSECIPQDELVSFLAEAVGVREIRLPVPYRLYRAMSAYARWHSRRIQAAARERGLRPKVDAPMTNYLGKNMWYSSRKLRELGFEFEYFDPKKGLWEFVTWCKERGRLP